jgi:ADP-ribose pyrophosphatase YjhB (NUDIX family)
LSRFYRFCPVCRGELVARRIPAPDGPERRVCPACGFVQWRNSKPTAAGIVVDEEGRLLLGKRNIAPFLGWWDVPGGFLEPGEHPEDGVRRELREETGLEVEPEQMIGVYMDTYGDPGDGGNDDGGEPILNFYYRCRVVGGAPRAADDVEELAWFPPDALPARIAFPSSCAALRDWRKQQDTREGGGE